MIHTFTALGQYLVADVNSGAVHVLDRMSYDLLSLLEKEETMGETCPREIRERLTKQAVVKALCLHVSHDCNLRCRYCFASTGDFGTGHRMTMDFETAKQAIDWVVKKSGKRRNIEVDFFGGEPLMAMDTVKKTVEYARSLEKEHDLSLIHI